jgi:hypothetical protein
MNVIRDRARELRRLGTSYALIGLELGIPKQLARKLTRDVPVAGDVVRDIEGRAWPKWRPARSGNIDGAGI